MASFLQMMYNASFRIIEGFSLLGYSMSVPFRTYVQALFPGSYDAIVAFFSVLSDLPILGDLNAFLFGSSDLLDCNWLQLMTFNVVGLLICRVVMWFVDVFRK